MTIEHTHRTLADYSKPEALIPEGVWNKIRAIKLTSRERTIKPKDRDEYDTIEYTLSAEAVEPGKGVSPSALAELNPSTGKPAYEGRRLFLRFLESYPRDMLALTNAVKAFGLPDTTELGVYIKDGVKVEPPLITKNLLKGRMASGEIWNKPYVRDDGSDAAEQRVRSWAPVGTAHGFKV